MAETTTFTSDKEPLKNILEEISSGEIQLPEFQRGWVWDDEHIRSLLASVSMSYPIGAVMMLENGNPDVRFKARPIEGVDLSENIDPERYILDGQQRLTSLYQALSINKAVKTRDSRKKEVIRWYYIDMNKALDEHIDREDAIVSLPEDRVVRNFRNEILSDYSTEDSEYENCLFPVYSIFNSSSWRREFNKYWQHDDEKSNLFDRFEEGVLESFKQYLVPVIKLLKNTPKVAVCQVFEKVNTGGVSLTVFELVTASFAADGYNLREDWEGKRNSRGQKVSEGRKDKIHDHLQHKVLQSVKADELLQAIALLATFEKRKTVPDAPVSCKKNDILKVTLDEYKQWADPATEGFIKAGKLLFQQKLFTSRDLPYSTQLVPLSVILTVLGEKAEIDTSRSKIVKWFWCGVFGELYGSATETRFAKDVVDVIDWINGGGSPKTIDDCNFVATRLHTLRTKNSAAYKGLYAILMRDGCLDFRTGENIEVQSYFDDSIDIHHIFPRAWCQKQNIEARLYDSIINKTPLAKRTNRIIGGNAPTVYLEKLRKQADIQEERQDEILKSHVIDLNAVKNNDFQAFYNARREALLERIENATGIVINRDVLKKESSVSDEEDDVIEEGEDL